MSRSPPPAHRYLPRPRRRDTRLRPLRCSAAACAVRYARRLTWKAPTCQVKCSAGWQGALACAALCCAARHTVGSDIDPRGVKGCERHTTRGVSCFFLQLPTPERAVGRTAAPPGRARTLWPSQPRQPAQPAGPRGIDQHSAPLTAHAVVAARGSAGRRGAAVPCASQAPRVHRASGKARNIRWKS